MRFIYLLLALPSLCLAAPTSAHASPRDLNTFAGNEHQGYESNGEHQVSERDVDDIECGGHQAYKRDFDGC
ncbi:hypothetical protein BDV38DRAFT_284397 [Aspergillus pseudotamarii]|uniref:Uncharacterized protein n=1 Tax=Aspergillus pseudotamarii TaxID=132259 RepID=A0A5N6SQ79_ASPPS|nr:uncharacterized protein BDV38DRAFT_284397 [Aspergillus pseudotamarii]KAE8135920.1 hypothetical protein BDV38DRAFT_284397 [Aspergillus pseudotamarii]